LAAIARPFSTYFIGACIERLLYKSLLWTQTRLWVGTGPDYLARMSASYGKVEGIRPLFSGLAITSRGWAGEGVGWHTRQERTYMLISD
jgi:hypothetical protein